MKRFSIRLLCAALLMASASGATVARQESSFQRVGTFAVYTNNPSRDATTVAEIIAATADGKTLVYTDALLGTIGFIDINDPSHPQGTGTMSFPAGHEPTSVDILGNKYALVAVDSSPDFVNPSGYLAVIDIEARTVVRAMPLGGQPDSIKISPDNRFAGIAMENERNESLPMPQLPGGFLAVIRLQGPPANWTQSNVSLSNLGGTFPTDPEPEFLDINHDNHAIVSLQENNYYAIVDLDRGTVLDQFSAGNATVSGVDTNEAEKDIVPDDTITNIPREPDAVVWLKARGGRYDFAAANEGDLSGGTRGFTIYDDTGTIQFDSGSALERLAIRYGHYPEDRSENKGTEPEAVEFGKFNGTDYLFVGTERGSFIGVYELDKDNTPQLAQLLSAPLGPEGLLAIPHRKLLIASGEVDAPPVGVRTTVMIYEYRHGAPTYPQVASANTSSAAGAPPIAWSAMSGLTAIPGVDHELLAVWDGFYNPSRIFRMNVAGPVATITEAITINRPAGRYDPEGITIAPDNTIWIASEGDQNDSPRPNYLVQVNSNGTFLREVQLPADVLACRALNRKALHGSGFEGVAAVPKAGGGYRLYVAQQRGWDYATGTGCEAVDDDAGGLDAHGEPNRSRIWIFDPVLNTWTSVAWQLAPLTPDAAWTGLSEITLTPDGQGLVLIERDNRSGDFGLLKTLVHVPLGALDDGIVTANEKRVFDIRPALLATNGWITDKPEGVAITAAGSLFVITDNDGVSWWSGETWFLRLGDWMSRFSTQ